MDAVPLPGFCGMWGVICAVIFGYLMYRQMPILDALAFTVVLLVAAIPIAIQVVSTTTLAMGCRALAKFFIVFWNGG